METISTTRLTIRRLVLDDATFILKLLNQPDWLRFIGDKNVTSTLDARDYIREGPMSMYLQHGYSLNLIELKASAQPVGICGLIKHDYLPEPDLGFALLEPFQSEGYAFEAANATIIHAREILNIGKILAITTQDNIASIGLLEKLGFLFEENFLDQENKKLNLYSLLKSINPSPAP